MLIKKKKKKNFLKKRKKKKRIRTKITKQNKKDKFLK